MSNSGQRGLGRGNGGNQPGSGNAYESSADGWGELDPGLTSYMLDHRGTGRSSMLWCPTQEAPSSPKGRELTVEEWGACATFLQEQVGGALDHFTTSNAARDLGWLIDKTREDQAVHVFGSSYGTYWAHRFLQIFPDRADGVSMLGVASPGFTFTEYDVRYNDVGISFMNACGADPFCSSKLGVDPAATMGAVYDMIEEGHCQEAGLDKDTLRVYLASLLSWSGNERAYIPAVIYRLQRCDPADVVALQNASPQMQDPLRGILNDPLFSLVMNKHVAYSEMWELPTPTRAEVDAYADDLLFLLRDPYARFEVYPVWPTYPEPDLAEQFAETETPMLMLTGEFDPNSPLALAQAMGDQFTAPNQTFVGLPAGNHGWFSPTTQGYECAFDMFWKFLQDPTTTPTDCSGSVVPVNWAGTPALALSLFGTDDLYEN